MRSTSPIFPAKQGSQPRVRRLSRSMWVHPIVIFSSVWGLTIYLYDLHLSALLLFSTNVVMHIVAWIVIPFGISTFVYLAWSSANGTNLTALQQKIKVRPLERKIKIAFATWAALTIVEIGVSGGVPLLWLFQGNSKTYADFGIASVHGLLNSLLLSIGLIEFALFALTGRKRHLWIPGFVLLWSFIAVTRNMFIVVLVEWSLAWAIIRGITWKTIAKASLAIVAPILIFGYIGDVRTGSEQFRQLAQPSPDYPEWLPSGVLWVYIYISTPINNLVNTVQSTRPIYNPLFPNATSLLFPSVLRQVIYKEADITEALSGDLVAESLNVSTAYVGPFRDYGMTGIALFSMIMGIASAHYWHDRSLRGSLIYAVLAQCLAISIFFNHLFYLPVITQVFWIYVFLPKCRNLAKIGAL